MSVMNNPGDNLWGNYQFPFHNPTVKCYSIHVRFNIPWKICFRLYIFFTHKSNVKNTNHGPSWNVCHTIFFGYTPEIWRTDTKKWFRNMYLWLQICTLNLFWGSQSLKFQEGKLPCESGILISLEMDAPILHPQSTWTQTTQQVTIH